MIKYGILNYHTGPVKLQLSDRIFEKEAEAQKVIDKRYKSGRNPDGLWRNKDKRSITVKIDIRELDFEGLINTGGI